MLYNYEGIFVPKMRLEGLLQDIRGAKLTTPVKYPHILLDDTERERIEEESLSRLGKEVTIRISGYANTGRLEAIKCWIESAPEELQDCVSEWPCYIVLSKGVPEGVELPSELSYTEIESRYIKGRFGYYRSDGMVVLTNNPVPERMVRKITDKPIRIEEEPKKTHIQMTWDQMCLVCGEHGDEFPEMIPVSYHGIQYACPHCLIAEGDGRCSNYMPLKDFEAIRDAINSAGFQSDYTDITNLTMMVPGNRKIRVLSQKGGRARISCWRLSEKGVGA